MLENIGIWIAAIGTISMMSFAWRENPAYRLFEHIYIGIGAGHATVMGWQNLKSNVVSPLQNDNHFIVIIPVILGLLLYSRFFKGYTWLSRTPISILVGIGVGLTMRGTVGSQLLRQLKATMLPLTSLDNIILVLGTAAVVIFFYFTAERKGVFKHTSFLGRYIMMIAFGATFGNAVMGRMSMMIGRFQFLMSDWLGIL